MGRRRSKNTIAKIHRKAAQGRGRGSGDSYKPGIYTYEIPSKGKVARVKGMTSGRVHHCLSSLEKRFLLLLDCDSLVSEIKEQYLLPLEETLMIAAESKIRHPSADQCPSVMSTDFYYCRNGHWYAVAIKTTEDLKEKRTQEKLEIERMYWAKKGIPWKIVTEKEIPRQKATNLEWLYSGEPIEVLIPDEAFRKDLEEAFLELYDDLTIPFAEIIDTMESYCRLRPGTVLQMYKNLIRKDKIAVDLERPLYSGEPRHLT